MPIARLAEERQKRNKYLQQKVHETLALAPPDQPALLKRFQNATYPLSADEEKASVRQYQEKLRLNRMLQVRAQEMLFASQRVEEFRDRNVKGNKKLLNHLKEVWREDQRRRIASLEDEFANACQSIGLSHDAAMLVECNRAAKEKLHGRQAEESRCWEILRFEEAMQKEREIKGMRETVDKAPTVRRRIVESVSNIERSLARRYTPRSKPRTLEKIACCQSVYPPISHDVEQDIIYNRLAGYPADFKDTFLHCRYSVLRDRTNRPSSAVVNCPHRDGVDAWCAADAERESNRRKRERQAELDRLYNERKLERGNAAAAKLLNDQRIALLEQEVEEALKEEERQKDRIHAVQLLCRRPISADLDKRPLYTKHKISYPLSCPGLPHSSLTCSRCRRIERPVPKSERKGTTDISINCVPDGELTILDCTSNVMVQEGGQRISNPAYNFFKATQFADLAVQVYIIPFGSLAGSMIDERTTENVASHSKHSMAVKSERRLEPVQGHSVASLEKLPERSSAKSSVEGSVYRKLESMIDMPQEEGSIFHKKPGFACINLEDVKMEVRTTDGDTVVNNPIQQSVSDDGADMTDVKTGPFFSKASHQSVAGVQDPKSCSKSPGRVSYERVDEFLPAEIEANMPRLPPVESVGNGCLGKSREGEMEFSKEVVGLYHREFQSQKGTQSHNHATDVGDRQRSQSVRKLHKPPFISSGSQGYKKICTEPPLSSRSSRLIPATDWGKVADNAIAERASSVQSFTGSGRGGASADRRSNLEIVKENGKEDVYRSNVCPPRGTFRLSPVTHMGDCSKAKKHVMETSRSWPSPGNPHACLENLQMEGKVYGFRKQIKHGVWNNGNRQQQPHAESVLGKSLGSPKSWDSRLRCNGGMRNDMSGACFSEMFYDSSRSREDPLKKSECKERIQEPKMVRQRAAWKSYIDEPSVLKKQSNVVEKIEAAPRPSQSVKSESSLPPFKLKRSSPTCSHQGDCQSEAGLELLPKVSQGRNCDTPATSVKSLPNLSAKRPRRHKVGGMSGKDPSLSRLGIQVGALENITTRIKTLSKRFHSPVKLVSPETVLWRSQKEISPDDTYCLPTLSSSQKDHARKLEEFIKSPKRSNEVVPPSPFNVLANKEESTRNDTRARSVCNIAEKILNAWKTGNFDDEYTKTLKRAKELPGEFGSSRSLKINPERRYMKPWLSSSPSRRSPDLVTNYGNRKDGVPKERISFTPEMCAKTAISPSPVYSTLSQKCRTLANKSLMGQVKVTNKSPMMKSGVRSARIPSTRDPWEAQSLDFVLGSLSDQVRELDKRLRSATASSPTLSSPSLKGSPHRGAMQMSNQPSFMSNLHYNFSKATQCKDYNSLSSSVGSSPERRYQENNSSPTAGRKFAGAYVHHQKQSNNHPTFTTGGKPTAGMYMDDLKTLLREIDSENLSPRRTAPKFSVKKLNPMSTAASYRDESKDYVDDQSALLYATNRYDPTKPQIKTGFEPQFASNTSISPDSSTACSQASQRVQHDTRVVLVGKGKTHAVRVHMEGGKTGKVQLDNHKTSNGKSNLNRVRKARRTIKNRNRTSHQVIDYGREDPRGIRKENSSARKNTPDEVAHEGKDDLGKRSNGSRWVPKQTAERGHEGIREKLEKRTVEVRGCAPHQILHKGHTVVRKISAKGIVVEDSIASFSPTNDHNSVRKGVDEGSAGRRWVTEEVMKVSRDNTASQKQSLENQSLECVASDGTSAPDGHVAIQENLERRTTKRGWASPHAGSDGGHLVVLQSLERKTVKRVANRVRDLAHSKDCQKMTNGQPESPLWGQDRSPHSPGDWRKHGLTMDEVEKRLLLSGSVDFSPWNTEKIPDITSQSTLEDGNHRSKPSSPAVPEAGPASWFHKNDRLKLTLSEKNKSLPTPTRKFGLQQQGPQSHNDSSNFDPSPTPSQDSVPVNASLMRTQVLQRLKRPNSAPKGGDALWALSGLDGPAERSRVPRSASADRKQRATSSAPSNQRSQSRPKRESSSSREEMPDVASKGSQDDNCLPVVMARDNESRREVIERRKKARQLDTEHRQRLCSRSSRPSSARSSA